MARNLIYFQALYKDGFHFAFDRDNDDILVYKSGSFIFKSSPYNGVYESVICVGDTNNLTLKVGSSNNVLDKSYLWHYRLGHINKKCIAKLQKDEILEAFNLESNDVCKSSLLDKMIESFHGKL